MNREELLRPRYKVISDWPGRKDFEVDQIVVLDKDFSPQYQMYEIEDCQGKRQYINSFFEMFPLQFKKLNWFEDINPEQMPQFLKFNGNYDETGKIEKMADYKIIESGFGIAYTLSGKSWWLNHCIPATEQEYLDYLTQQNKINNGTNNL